MAEAVTRDLIAAAGLEGEVTVESFGTTGYHAGASMEPDAAATLVAHGWEPGNHRARQLTAVDLERLDLVLCADRSNLQAVRALSSRAKGSVHADIVLLRALDPVAPEGAEVPDPYLEGTAAFERSLAVIEPACRALVERLAASGGDGVSLTG